MIQTFICYKSISKNSASLLYITQSFFQSVSERPDSWSLSGKRRPKTSNLLQILLPPLQNDAGCGISAAYENMILLTFSYPHDAMHNV